LAALAFRGCGVDLDPLTIPPLSDVPAGTAFRQQALGDHFGHEKAQLTSLKVEVIGQSFERFLANPAARAPTAGVDQ
jgi:hypothetical protein